MNSTGDAVVGEWRRRLFYDFRFEDHVPADHALRAIDQLLDTALIRKVMAPHHVLPPLYYLKWPREEAAHVNRGPHL
jgi:hypothetical protein